MAGKAEISGSCHCGNIRFTFTWPGGATIPVRACGCDFCVKHGGVYTSHPDGGLSVTIEDGSQANAYRFGSATADFHICRQCGVVPVVTSEIDGTRYGVVNVNTFEDVDRACFDRADTDFEGEATEDRLARRQRNWIPNVTISP